MPVSTLTCLNQECVFEANLLIKLFYCASLLSRTSLGVHELGSPPVNLKQWRPPDQFTCTLATSGHAVWGTPSQLARSVHTSLRHPWCGKGSSTLPELLQKTTPLGLYCSCRPSVPWLAAHRKLVAGGEEEGSGLERSPTPLSRVDVTGCSSHKPVCRHSKQNQRRCSQRLVKALGHFVTIRSQAEKESSVIALRAGGSMSSNLIQHQRTTAERCSNSKKPPHYIYILNSIFLYLHNI